MTAAVEDDIAGAFEAALAADAGVPAPAAEPSAPAPPRKPDPAEASQRPAPKPRPAKTAKADAKPRTAPAAAAKDGEARDYTGDLLATADQVWFGASMVRGGKLGPVRLPDLRPYAAVFHDQAPQLAQAWNAAAQQNAAVRGVVSKLGAGDGGVSWVIGVGIATAGLVSACASIATAPAEVRDKLTAANDKAMNDYIKAILDRAGLQEAA